MPDIDGTCLKICFHDAEVFFYFPTLSVDFLDSAYIVFGVCDDSIKAVIFFLIPDFVQIKQRAGIILYLTVVLFGAYL